MKGSAERYRSHTALARQLVQDEMLDLALYQRLERFASPELHPIIKQLIETEVGHVAFWKEFFGRPDEKLSIGRQVKLFFLSWFARIFKDAGVHLILEAVEIYGIRKYLRVWDIYKHDETLSAALHNVLQDEFRHEDTILSDATRRKIHPERIRDIFLGFNDGLVEILGAVSGFFAAFQAASSVLAASLTVAVAGSISMAAGVFVAMGSEKEVERTEKDRKKFLGEETGSDIGVKPFASAIVVGVSYFVGALVPVLPVFFGAQNVLVSVAVGVFVIIGVSYLLAFLSGMDVRRRIALNLVIIAIAVSVTYGIGVLAKSFLGVSI